MKYYRIWIEDSKGCTWDKYYQTTDLGALLCDREFREVGESDIEEITEAEYEEEGLRSSRFPIIRELISERMYKDVL